MKATFNAIPSYLLTVTKEGTGVAKVFSTNTVGINCGTKSCSYSYFEPTVVTLKAFGSQFVEWTDCNSAPSTSRVCEVSMTAAKEAKVKYML